MERLNTNMFDVKVKIVSDRVSEDFEKKLNEFLKELTSSQAIIEDIQFQSIDGSLSALVVYTTSRSLM